MIRVANCFPVGWRERLKGGKIGIGADIATTTKKTSNPAAIAVIEQVNLDYWVRAVIRFKTNDGDLYEALLREAATLPAPMRSRGICLDATSERFFAAKVAKRFAGFAPVHLIIASEATEYLGERMNFKQYLGNLVVNAFEDNRLAMAPEVWLRNDVRSVKRDRGTFEADLAEDGGHGDCFVAISLALHALSRGGGPSVAHAVQVGNFGQRLLRRLRNPWAHKFENQGGRLNA